MRAATAVRATDRSGWRSSSAVWSRAFWVGLVLSAALYVVWDSRLFWYFDDWNVVGPASTLASHPLHDLFAAHNGQWAILLILIFRGLEAVFGLSHYLPYAIPGLLTQLAIVVLLRRVLLREGVGDALSCLMPFAVMFIAVAYDDVLWDFQLGFLGSVAFGLLAVELLAPDRRPGRLRVAAAAGACLVSVMFSNIGVGMLVLVLVYAALRHRARHGLVVLPAAVAFAAWYTLSGARLSSPCAGQPRQIGTVPLFAASAIEHSLDDLGGFKFSSIPVVALIIIDLITRYRSNARAPQWAFPVGAVLAAAVLYIEIAGARSCFGLDYARQPRYAYFAAVLLLPSVAGGLRAVAAGYRRGLVVAGVLVLLVDIANLSAMRSEARLRRVRTQAGALQLAAAHHAQLTGRPIPDPPSVVDPQVSAADLHDLTADYGLRLPHTPAHPPSGDPGE